MARPIKEGVEYYPKDVNTRNGELKYIDAKYPLEGYAIYFKLCDYIYDNSYYRIFEERDVIMFCADNNIIREKFNPIFDDCVKEKLFNKELLKKYSILTSAGIQKRYITICSRRSEIKLIHQYLLVDVGSKIYDRAREAIRIIDLNTNKILTKAPKKKLTPEFDFEKVWALYPKQRGKLIAEKWFNENIVNQDLYNDLIKAIENYKQEIDNNDTPEKYIKSGSNFFSEDYKSYLKKETIKKKNKTAREVFEK